MQKSILPRLCIAAAIPRCYHDFRKYVKFMLISIGPDVVVCLCRAYMLYLYTTHFLTFIYLSRKISHKNTAKIIQTNI